MADNVIDKVRGRSDALLVPMNEVGFALWSSARRYLATEGLNGCTGAAIISKTAGILAHIAPRRPFALPESIDPGFENLKVMVQRVITLHNTYKQHFPDGHSCIVAALHQNAVALPEQVQTMTAVLRHLRLPVKTTHYDSLEPGMARLSGQTSLVIDASAPGWPKMYICTQEFNYD